MASNKFLNPVDIHVDADLDADDLGQRLVDCVKQIDSEHNVINLVKIHFGEGARACDVPTLIEKLVLKPLKEMGATNCICVPLKTGIIEDITIDHIEVLRKDVD